jgi:hypothetical protein
MEEKGEIFSKEIGHPFNSEKDISKREKRIILTSINYLLAEAKDTNTTSSWAKFCINAMFAKLLFPKEEKLQFNNEIYKTTHTLSEETLKKGNFFDHTTVAVAEKILFPEQWSLRSKDFHSDELFWNKSREIFKDFSKSGKIVKWVAKDQFFYSAQNLKILAPERFKTINIQKILGNIWQQDIIEELESLKKENYSNFTFLAAPLQILEYPSRMEIEPDEWGGMEIEAQKLKDQSFLSFCEFSSRRNILAAKDIEITNESFDE